MKELIIEILSEEIPARFQVTASEQLKDLFESELAKSGFDFSDVKIESTPRRMMISSIVSEKSKQIIEEKKGPIANAPENVISAFLSSLGISMDGCIEKVINGKKYIFANITVDSVFLRDEIPRIINKILNNFKWPKSMRWGNRSFLWARPISSIMCVYHGKAVQFYVEALNFTTSNFTKGHRFLSDSNLKITTIEEYYSALERNSVILSREKRKNIILQKFGKIEQEYGIKIDVNQNLLEEIIGLVEFPIVYFGEFSNEFMILPEEVLSTTMRVHQRYFTTRDLDGKTSNHFAFVSNMATIDNGKTVIKGNQRVLAARLYDAKFFFEQDKKVDLVSHLESLKRVSFQDGLGTMYDRVNRIILVCEKLSRLSSDKESLIRAAKLCKCDLKTGVVNEFPELQGVMGGHYAKLQGENEYIYKAISEHYLPFDDKFPESEGGILLSLADKIDILVSFFSINKGPTGSKDPFALRRSAIGILKLIIKNNIKLPDLSSIITELCSKLKSDYPETNMDCNAARKIMQFLRDRLAIMLKDEGINQDVVNVFLSKNPDILDLANKSRELKTFLSSNENGIILEIYKRVTSICSNIELMKVDESSIANEHEKSLYESIIKAQYKFFNSDSISSKLKIISTLYVPLEEFFRNVLVNDSDDFIKARRIGILHMVTAMFDEIGDFGELVE